VADLHGTHSATFQWTRRLGEQSRFGVPAGQSPLHLSVESGVSAAQCQQCVAGADQGIGQGQASDAATSDQHSKSSFFGHDGGESSGFLSLLCELGTMS